MGETHAPVEVGADSVEDLGAVLILLPLGRVELEDGLVHQVDAILQETGRRQHAARYKRHEYSGIIRKGI